MGTCVASMPNGDILITAGTHIPMLESCVEIAHEVSVAPLIFGVLSHIRWVFYYSVTASV